MWELIGYSTEERGENAVRHRQFTTSERTKDLFLRVPRLDFTDSGHGVVFTAAVAHGRGGKVKTMPHVVEHMKRLREEARRGPARPKSQQVLDLLAARGELDQLEIMTVTGMRQSGCSGVLNRLLEENRVTYRLGDPEDRGRRHVSAADWLWRLPQQERNPARRSKSTR